MRQYLQEQRRLQSAWLPTEQQTEEPLAKLRLLTLKALANSSPGLRFGNPGEQRIPVLRRNSEGVASRVANKNRHNSFRVATNLFRLLDPGFQSKPWAGISQRFQRKGKSYVLGNLVLLTTLSRRVLQEALQSALLRTARIPVRFARQARRLRRHFPKPPNLPPSLLTGS